MPHFMIVLIPYINLLNLSKIKKCQFLRNIEHLNSLDDLVICCMSGDSIDPYQTPHSVV